MDELTVAFQLPEEFRFQKGGLGIININENDSLLALFYSAKFGVLKEGVKIRSDKFVVYFPKGWEAVFLQTMNKLSNITDATMKFYETNKLDEILAEDVETGFHPLFIV